MKPRELVILILGAVGFLSQIVAQFTGGEPSYLVMGGSLALLGVAPFLRADEARRGEGRDPDPDPGTDHMRRE